MSKIVNEFLLAAENFMPKLHLRQSKFTDSTCGQFIKHLERIQKLKQKQKKTGNLNHIYKSDLNEACFVHEAAYSDSKDLPKRAILYRILKDRAYEFAINPKYDKYQRGLAVIRKVYARFKDNIWTVDLAEMGSSSSENWGVKYLFCVIDVVTKYAWVKALKDKRAKTVCHGFIGIVSNLNINQINYGWIKEGNITINLCTNGSVIMIF